VIIDEEASGYIERASFGHQGKGNRGLTKNMCSGKLGSLQWQRRLTMHKICVHGFNECHTPDIKVRQQTHIHVTDSI
jgi:hypothetical protein